MLDAFIASVPKVELHLHLVGSASPHTVSRLAAAHPDVGVPADPEALDAFFTFRDFLHFVEVYSAVNSLVLTAADIAEVIEGAARDLAPQGVPYVEMTVTPYMHTVRGMPYGAFVEGLDEGRRLAAALGVDMAWVYDIPGEHGQEGAVDTLARALDEPPDALVAFGLAGAEAGVDRSSFAWAFDQARAVGLRSVPHAGEGDGPASVWAALGYLRADRIGHGVRAVEDPRLLEHLVDRQVPLEVCPSSNVRTGVVRSLDDHPVGALIEAGALVTINTDDPPMFGTTLTNEYRRVAAAFDLDLAAVAGLVRNAISASFMPHDGKRALLAEVDLAIALARPEGDRR